MEWDDKVWPPLLAMGMSVALLLMGTFAEGVLSPVWGAGLFLAGAVLFTFIVSWGCWHIRDRWGGCLVILTWAIGSALGGTFVWQGATSLHLALYPPPPKIERPKLRVRLVPEAVVGTRLAFHISVENLGPGDVEVLRQSFRSPGDFRRDTHSPERKLIAAGDALTFPVHEHNLLMEVRRGAVEVTYHVVGSSEIRTARYEFQLPENIGGPIAPMTYEDQTGFGSGSELAFFQERFAMPAGAVQFGFREVLNGKPNIVGYAGSGRSIYIDSANRVARFSTVQNDRVRIFERRIGATRDMRHVMAAAWDDENNWAVAAVDGKPMSELTAP